jgi:glutamine amidotransferase
VLFKPAYSLVLQSLHARSSLTTTNGDGFGMGWYGQAGSPRLYRSTNPAWNDRNLREIASEVESPMFFAPCALVHRRRRAADQLPSVPSRTVAVHA